MAKKRRGKNIEQIVPSTGDESGKNSTGNPNVESLRLVKSTEQQLEKIIRKQLDDLYREALSRLVFMVNNEDEALKGLLKEGYCSGMSDCLTNVVVNSLEFLTGKEVDSKQENQPQPFLNLELIVEFNLQFMVYILQQYRPNLNRISACQCLLMNDLNLNQAILMDVNNHTPSVMLSNLNLDDDDDEDDEDDINVDKDRFLALEIREMLNNLNVVDESVSEDMKDMMIANSQKMIDDLEEQLKERIRWASKKVAQARAKRTTPIMNLRKEMQLFRDYADKILYNKSSTISSADNELVNLRRSIKCLETAKEDIKTEMAASKLIESETKNKCLGFSKSDKKNRGLKNWEKQKVKLQEEISMENKKISKLEKQLVEIEADKIQAELKLGEVKKARRVALAQFHKENRLYLESWENWNRKIEDLNNQVYADRNTLMEKIPNMEKDPE